MHLLSLCHLIISFTRFFIYFLFLYDEGQTLETLDFTVCIGSTPTFSFFDSYIYSTYAAHYVYLTKITSFCMPCEHININIYHNTHFTTWLHVHHLKIHFRVANAVCYRGFFASKSQYWKFIIFIHTYQTNYIPLLNTKKLSLTFLRTYEYTVSHFVISHS